MAEQLTPTNARSLRGNNFFLHKVNDRLTVRMRRLDMVTMVMERLIPFKLLKAAEKFEKLEKGLGAVQSAEGKDRDAALDALDPLEIAETMEFIRHYVTVVVVEPKIVLVDDDVPEHLPISELTGEELMAIFYAYPPKSEAPVTTEQAEDFRRTKPADDGAPAHHGTDVRAETKLVALSDREVIHA